MILAATMLNACASGSASPNRTLIVDDAQQGQSLAHVAYSGRWEHLRGRRDGRFDGTSSRSYYARASLVVPFSGSAVRVYGVRGPNGGNAAIAIDGRYYGSANFFAPRKQVHALVFESPQLHRTVHTLGLLVRGDTTGSHRAYVNLDSIEVLEAP